MSKEAREILKGELETLLGRVNQLLPPHWKLKLARRYNYYALDIYDEERGGIVDTLIAGLSFKEVKNILYALDKALYQTKLKRVV